MALIAGALSDRFGEKRLLVAGYALIVLTAVLLATASDFLSLMSANCVSVISRAAFWSPPQAYLSRLSPHGVGQRLGTFNASSNAGFLIGSAVAGISAVSFGFRGAFLGVCGLGFLALLVILPLRGLPAPRNRRSFGGVLRSYPGLARNRALGLGVICSFMAASSVALTSSFYPVYMASVGISTGLIGVLTALRSLGSMGATSTMGRVFDRVGGLRVAYTGSLLLYAVALGVTPLVREPLIIGALLAMMGFGSGVLNVMYLVLVAGNSTEATRGAAMAYVGNYWAASYLIVPAAYGFIAQVSDLSVAFHLSGAVSLALAVASVPTFRALLPGGFQTTSAQTAQRVASDV
jgi:MFS family permease